MSDSAAVPVAVCQFAPTASRSDNRDRIAELTADAAARGAKVIVFPEYSSYFVNPMDSSLASNAEDLEGEFVAALTALAADYAVVIVAGLVERATDGDHVRNTVVAVRGDGILAVYRKQHLYDAFGQTESDWIEPGDPGMASTFDVAGLRFGLMTCYDLRFPEVARVLIDADTDVLVVPAEWVRGPLKEHHWTTLLAARAIENTAYVIAADHPGPIGVGHSQIVDPEGVVLAGVGAVEGIAVAAVEHASIERVRDVNPSLRVRRYTVTPR
ncbi:MULTISPECIES: carbon-nitrogen hydrolase family protein [unclassified Microbacterium]|uniref:carbon-nitrogen hydrolase family protein n=1 Tax=unclassified Microbacterium TaxID=2609290 RepID=UPI000EA9F4CB|nr:MULTISPECIES: carbon-nitrogen hydrolase family protein [unclassified Microbacterium]MBT2485363.1 carbon-nitrogen hydrolase family protein [Microbacterium sp. ISL-108]RKN69590.1 carbon-nitrogen hydrolase family protein [Microbacterium sp. CGR2]